LLGGIEGYGYPLTNTNAHGTKSTLVTTFGQHSRSRSNQTRTGSAQRVTKRDCPTVPVYVLCAVFKAKLSNDGQNLCGECFIDFDDVEVINA